MRLFLSYLGVIRWANPKEVFGSLFVEYVLFVILVLASIFGLIPEVEGTFKLLLFVIFQLGAYLFSLRSWNESKVQSFITFGLWVFLFVTAY
jgi:hypothetical protein